MKKINIFFAALLSLGMLASCSKFLDKSPEENLTLDDIFASRIYTRAFLANAYSYLPSSHDKANVDTPFTSACDEMECAYGSGYNQIMNSGGWTPQNIGTTAIWRNMYAAIRKCNMLLERINECPATETEIRQWTGEAHFLRANYTFLLFRVFGPVPIPDKVWNVDQDFNAIRRAPADDVVKFICDDCDRAAELLYNEDVWLGDDLGRATRLAALALKARTLLYIASPLYNGNPQQAELRDPVTGTQLISQTYDPEKWRTAYEAADRCISMAKAAGKGLYNQYPEDPVKNYQFMLLDRWNEEILWAKNITDIHWLNCSEPVSFRGFSIFDPTQEMVDAYEMEDGSTPILGYTDNGMKPIINPASGYVEEGFCTEPGPDGRWQAGVWNMYTHREPRFYASINFSGAIWKYDAPNYNKDQPHTLEFFYKGVDGRNAAGSDFCKTGYIMRKLLHPDYRVGGYVPLLMSPYIRMAEMYLSYAEALNEYSGPTQEVYEAVNAVRNRAGLPGLKSGLSKEEMRERIKHERRIELAFEEHRWFDVRRWLDAEKTECLPIHSMNIYVGETRTDPAYYERIKIEDRVFEAPKHYFFPIEQVEIEKSQSRSLVQNLGWTTEIDYDEE